MRQGWSATSSSRSTRTSWLALSPSTFTRLTIHSFKDVPSVRRRGLELRKCTGHPKAHGCSTATENAHESARAIDGLVPYSVATPRQKSVPIVFLLAESTGPRREYGGR